jgi:hypothetical protein
MSVPQYMSISHFSARGRLRIGEKKRQDFLENISDRSKLLLPHSPGKNYNAFERRRSAIDFAQTATSGRIADCNRASGKVSGPIKPWLNFCV